MSTIKNTLLAMLLLTSSPVYAETAEDRAVEAVFVTVLINKCGYKPAKKTYAYTETLAKMAWGSEWKAASSAAIITSIDILDNEDPRELTTRCARIAPELYNGLRGK